MEDMSTKRRLGLGRSNDMCQNQQIHVHTHTHYLSIYLSVYLSIYLSIYKVSICDSLSVRRTPKRSVNSNHPYQFGIPTPLKHLPRELSVGSDAYH